MAQLELSVPDIGGFADIPVIEVLVKPGDAVTKDAPLVTLESDKATMEVPATASGVVKDVRVKVGDKVSQGTVLVTVDSADAQSVTAVTPPVVASNDVSGVVASDAGAAEESRAPVGPPPRANEMRNGEAAPAAPAASQTIEMIVPDIGDFTDIPVIEVLVKAGDTVAKEDALVTLESDKATMEVPASHAGVLKDIRVKVGDRVSKGAVIATVETAGGHATAPNTNDVTLSLSKGGQSSQGQADITAAAPLRQAQDDKTDANAAPPVTLSLSKGGQSSPVHASPAIRRFARELGVELGRVRGSGPNGRITRDDVQGFVKTALATPGAANGSAPSGSGLALGLPAWPVVDFAKFGEIERVPLTRIQKISGPLLHRNWVMIPHVTQNEDADVTELEAFRKQINAERKDVKVTMLAFLIKAAVYALKAQPVFNSSLDGDALVVKKYFHIGFAADTPQGLLVPVIRDADKKGVAEIARETSDLAAKARDGKLGPADMSGATFTISSLGSIGGTTFTPIINAPEVAILGACRAEMRPVWDGKTFIPRLIQPLSLSYDHRVIDGAKAARFCVAIKDALADLRRVLL